MLLRNYINDSTCSTFYKRIKVKTQVKRPPDAYAIKNDSTYNIAGSLGSKTLLNELFLFYPMAIMVILANKSIIEM